MKGPGSATVRYLRGLVRADCRGTCASPDLLKLMAALSKRLLIEAAEFEEAVALAECLRLVEHLRRRHSRGLEVLQGRCYPADLAEFVKEIEKDYAFKGKGGAPSAHAFTGREQLLLCALYKVTSSPGETINLFLMLSKRSEDAVKEKVRKIVNLLSRGNS